MLHSFSSFAKAMVTRLQFISHAFQLNNSNTRTLSRLPRHYASNCNTWNDVNALRHSLLTACLCPFRIFVATVGNMPCKLWQQR